MFVSFLDWWVKEGRKGVANDADGRMNRTTKQQIPYSHFARKPKRLPALVFPQLNGRDWHRRSRRRRRRGLPALMRSRKGMMTWLLYDSAVRIELGGICDTDNAL